MPCAGVASRVGEKMVHCPECADTNYEEETKIFYRANPGEPGLVVDGPVAALPVVEEVPEE